MEVAELVEVTSPLRLYIDNRKDGFVRQLMELSVIQPMAKMVPRHLNAFLCPSGEHLNKVQPFTIRQGKPWVDSEGQEMMGNIDVRNLGNLRNKTLPFMLDDPLRSGHI